MKAVVWHGIGDIRLDEVPDPRVQDPTDAVVDITRSAICGTDLHFVRGTMAPMTEGTVLGHEAVGVVTDTGASVRGLTPGDRVVVASTISCGRCRYCRMGQTAQCDVANPNGPQAGTCFFGGPASTGPVNGLQAQKARIPWAANTLVPLPDNVSDDQAILLSDIFPTAWFGARLAGVTPGDTVLVLGAGVVGQLAIESAKRQGAGRVLVVDRVQTRLAQALEQHAEIIDFDAEDPVEAVMDLTGGIGVDRVIDAVGVDAQRPRRGPAAQQADQQAEAFAAEVAQTAPDAAPDGDLWVPGNAPSQAAQWAVQCVAKNGQIGVIGVYSPDMTSYPIGAAMNKNLTIRMGNCDHRTTIPPLVDLVATGVVDLTRFVSQHEPTSTAIEAYQRFDQREEGWLKTVLDVA